MAKQEKISARSKTLSGTKAFFTTKLVKYSFISSAPICRQTNPKKNMPNGVCRVDIFRLSTPPISGRSWSTRQGQTPTRQPRCLRTAATSRRASSGISDSEIPFCIDPAFWFKRRVVCPVIQPGKTSGANLMRPVTTTAERRQRGPFRMARLASVKDFQLFRPKERNERSILHTSPSAGLLSADMLKSLERRRARG